MPSTEAKTNSRRVKTLQSIFFLLLALPLFAAQQTINTGTNPNDGAGDSLRTAFTKVNANFTDLYNTALFSNSMVQWSSLTNTPATLAGYGITNGITAATAASTYAPIASPTFTGTVTIPSGASIASPTITGTPTVPTASVDTSTTQAASTAFVLGQAASATPLINGTAAVGTSTRYARGDHVHPTDTSRAPLASPVFTGSLTLPNWSTAGRPASPVAGMIGWNTDLLRFDHYTGGAGWKNFVRLDGDTMTGALTATSFSGAGTGLTGTASGLSIGGNAATATLATNATTATNIIGGSAGSLPYQTGSGATTTLGIGSANTVLTSSGTAPQWGTTLSGLTSVSLTSAAGLNWNSDTYLQRDAANIVAQRNSTTAQGFRVYNTYTDASNYERAAFDWVTTGNTLTIGTQNAGTGSARGINFATGGTTAMSISSAQAVSFLNGLTITGAGAFFDATGGGLSIRANNVTGAIYFATGGTTLRWGIESTGNLVPQSADAYTLGKSGNGILQAFFSKTITAAGTTGAQTINKASGSVNLAASATSLVVTDSLVSTSSVIICTVGSNDTTCKSVQAVAGSGSFTIYPNAAPTAETRVNFLITN